MTVTRVEAKEYIGLSTDKKPAAARVGARFCEYDTGQRYIWDKHAWHRITSATPPENQWYQHFLNSVGSRDMNVDGTGTAAIYKAICPAGKEVEAQRINIVIEGTKVDPSDFGGIAGGITNGVGITAHSADGTELIDYCNGFPVKTNIEWGILSGIDSRIQTGTGDDGLLVRFTFEKGSDATLLRAGHYLQAIISDDLTPAGKVVKFFMMAQGKIFNATAE